MNSQKLKESIIIWLFAWGGVSVGGCGGGDLRVVGVKQAERMEDLFWERI